MLRRSLKTADPRVAEREVTLAKAELHQAEARVSARENLDELVDALPPDRRRVYDEAGGLEGLILGFDRTAAGRALMIAGSPEKDPEDESDGRHAREVEMELAEHRAGLATIEGWLAEKGRTLRALGQDVEIPDGVLDLPDLCEDYLEKRAAAAQTRESYRYVVRRFAELHGNVPLDSLEIRHLREYADAVLTLPRVTSASRLKGLPFKEAAKVAAAEGLETITERTRAHHVSLLKALAAFGMTQGHLDADPWSSFGLVKPRRRHSSKARVREPFGGRQIETILAHAATLPPTTVDRWAPLLATYQGMRREEIGQLRGCDVFAIDGVPVLQVTDEAEWQKVKNASSFRVMPIHKAVLAAGFPGFAKERDADACLFDESARWGGSLSRLAPDARGRLTESYGKRFSRMLRKRIGISDDRLVFHSFRHAWEDAADAAGIPQSHRRRLAGRSAGGDSQAAYGAGPTIAALRDSLDRIDPTKLPR